jgi:hypothetical protein
MRPLRTSHVRASDCGNPATCQGVVMSACQNDAGYRLSTPKRGAPRRRSKSSTSSSGTKRYTLRCSGERWYHDTEHDRPHQVRIEHSAEPCRLVDWNREADRPFIDNHTPYPG